MDSRNHPSCQVFAKLLLRFIIFLIKGLLGCRSVVDKVLLFLKFVLHQLVMSLPTLIAIVKVHRLFKKLIFHINMPILHHFFLVFNDITPLGLLALLFLHGLIWVNEAKIVVS